MADSSGPLVSVGIPTRNRPAGLRRTLSQVTAQSYPNLEIIVSDNASSGAETEAVVREFQSGDPRISYHRQAENIGWDANFKFLLRHASGEFFFWAADDDERSPDFVETCLDHIGDSGSVMTDLRVAVRTRGLLRPTHCPQLSARETPYQGAVELFTNPQPSLFYGIHRRDSLQPFLAERMCDYYDFFFILRQILSSGFEVVNRVCFHVGVETEEPLFKPARPREDAVYEYAPFLSHALAAVAHSPRLSSAEKIRLALLLSYFTSNEFAHFEQHKRPVRTAVARGIMRLLTPPARLLRVPLPRPPSVLKLPQDPAAICYVFLPAADLESDTGIRAHLDQARGDLRAKEIVIEGLAAEVAGLLPWKRSAPHGHAHGEGSTTAGEPTLAAPTLDQLRRELGVLLLELEDREARIQTLIRWRKRLRLLTSASRRPWREKRDDDRFFTA